MSKFLVFPNSQRISHPSMRVRIARYRHVVSYLLPVIFSASSQTSNNTSAGGAARIAGVHH